ncbi:aminoglycoside phosphotransferase family protein [Castellaniella sp.]|uniref:aminoglycoside phosphotransferase family protein n=1 Tax=Castellaniella sp. TaxID=1955812 RepID=UPI00355DC464
MTASAPPDSRLELLLDWLAMLPDTLGLVVDSLAPVSGDASFRRYFRVLGQNDTPFIIMDAPPPHEDCSAFIAMGRLLAHGGLRVPEVLAQAPAHGFLLLTDLGPQNLQHGLEAGLFGPVDLQRHYRAALRALVRLQQCSASHLPALDASRLLDELGVFTHWYLKVHLGFQPDAHVRSTLQQAFALLARRAAAQPQVLVHRDYHSPNLIPAPAGTVDDAPGIIDFQDGLRGPITYDIASLALDARWTWDEPAQLDWAIRYWEYARTAGLPVDPDFARFHIEYEWMSLQRNLRILGVFARLSHRDQKHGYLVHLPRVLTYVRQVAARYPQFHPLLRVLDAVGQQPQTQGYSF